MAGTDMAGWAGNPCPLSGNFGINRLASAFGRVLLPHQTIPTGDLGVKRGVQGDGQIPMVVHMFQSKFLGF